MPIHSEKLIEISLGNQEMLVKYIFNLFSKWLQNHQHLLWLLVGKQCSLVVKRYLCSNLNCIMYLLVPWAYYLASLWAQFPGLLWGHHKASTVSVMWQLLSMGEPKCQTLGSVIRRIQKPKWHGHFFPGGHNIRSSQQGHKMSTEESSHIYYKKCLRAGEN